MTAVSARGLFRATGKKAKPSAVPQPDGSVIMVDQLDREKHDFYPTPPEPTRALLRAEADRLRDFPVIWEPACGDGAMAREIRAAGHKCVGTDLVPRWKGEGDFRIANFMAVTKPEAPAIVTNPPYYLVNWRDGKGGWITHALDVLGVEYMALLLSWSWPGAGGLGGIWTKSPPARVYLMRWKIDFTGAGAPPMLNGWFVWDRRHIGETVLRMLDRANDHRQRSLL